ncbi:MAG TPA: phospho-N-acetylmuramoyl-pentapeptide-transferase, partial [Pirellulales bacterium]|nr:phospho-N-acetylmuramoyl-pentapeptide-transferase [Pirellulales bacterium]
AWCAEFQTFVVLAIGLTIGMAGLGAIDDLLKCRRRCGLTRRQKLFGQICIATPIAVVFESTLADGSPWSAAWIVFVIVGSSNAVNLTDGLDGLAAGCCLWATAALGGIALLAHAADDVLVLAAALDGSLLAFFLFNRHPARIFMGDTGSLAIGALLGYLAIGLEREWVWLLVGGVFVAEAVSVIAQIAAFRFTGRRVLRCAPLHHHFQFLGWPETRVVRMLWAWAALCAVLGLLITASIIERPLAWQRLALARSTCR